MAHALNTMLSLTPYHLVAYGTLLGTQLYQSFVMTKICFQALPMPQFTTLQKKVFPIYFKLQVGLLALTAATHPPLSLLSLSKHWWEYVPLAVALGVSGLNLVVYGPRTEKVMIERVHQGTKDRNSGADDVSEDMKHINKAFSRTHAMAIHLNAIAMAATVWYGFSLASRVQLA